MSNTLSSDSGRINDCNLKEAVARALGRKRPSPAELREKLEIKPANVEETVLSGDDI
jgi:hypothetical protein